MPLNVTCLSKHPVLSSTKHQQWSHCVLYWVAFTEPSLFHIESRLKCTPHINIPFHLEYIERFMLKNPAKWTRRSARFNSLDSNKQITDLSITQQRRCPGQDCVSGDFCAWEETIRHSSQLVPKQGNKTKKIKVNISQSKCRNYYHRCHQ